MFRSFGRVASPKGLALMCCLTLVMAAWTTFMLRPEEAGWMPKAVMAWSALILYIFGAAFLMVGAVYAAKRRDTVAAWLLVLAVVAGGAMAGVVQKEPQSFYGASLGVFVGLILALAVLDRPRNAPEPKVEVAVVEPLKASVTVLQPAASDVFKDDEDKAWAQHGGTKPAAIHESRTASITQSNVLLALAGATLAGIAQLAPDIHGWPAGTAIAAVCVLILSALVGVGLQNGRAVAAWSIFQFHFDEKDPNRDPWLFLAVLIGHPRVLMMSLQLQHWLWLGGALLYATTLIGVLS